LVWWSVQFKTGVSSFNRVIGSLGLIFFKKSKRRRFSKKNKNQRIVTGFLTGSYQVNRVILGFSFLYFFSTPLGSQPKVNLSGWAEFQNYDINNHHPNE
jgi:hypothetical protein